MERENAETRVRQLEDQLTGLQEELMRETGTRAESDVMQAVLICLYCLKILRRGKLVYLEKTQISYSRMTTNKKLQLQWFLTHECKPNQTKVTEGSCVDASLFIRNENAPNLIMHF